MFFVHSARKGPHPQEEFERLAAERFPQWQRMMAAADKLRTTNYAKHPDRLNNQPTRWCCVNPTCRVNGRRFEFSGSEPRCPKCRGWDYPFVRMLSLCHLLVPDAKGPIRGVMQRFHIACAPKREVLATPTNAETFSQRLTRQAKKRATKKSGQGNTNIDVVTCTHCKEWARRNNYQGSKPLPFDGTTAVS